MKTLIFALALTLLGGTAFAETEPPPEQVEQPQAQGHHPIGIELAPKVGGLAPWSKLGLSWGADLELGYVTPLLHHKLAFVVDVGYCQPTHGNQVTDTRVGGGSYTFNITQRELNVFVGPKYYILPTDAPVLPFVGLGAKIQLMRSAVTGDASGQSLGDSSETQTEVGGALRGGVGFKVGPGHIVGELEVAYAGLDETVTGSSNAADLALQVGYLFIF